MDDTVGQYGAKLALLPLGFLYNFEGANAMRRYKYMQILLAPLAVLWSTCSNPTNRNETALVPDSALHQPPARVCGNAELQNVVDRSGRTLGILDIGNDSAHLYLTFAPANGVVLEGMDIYHGTLDTLARTASGTPDSSKFPIRATDVGTVDPWSWRIPLSEVKAACTMVAVCLHAEVDGAQATAWAEASDGLAGAHLLTYCVQACLGGSVACDLDGTPPVTMPCNAWEARENKSQLQRLREHFADLFPEGAVIGCDTKVVLEDVAAFLREQQAVGAPQTVSAQKSNQLVAEILSLEAMLRMEALVLSPDNPQLGHLEIASGAFDGWSVEQALEEAHRVVGGCTSSYSPEQMHSVLHAINAAFAGGKPSGYLRCPGI